MSEFARNDEERAMVRFLSGAVSFEHPYAGPPGMPPEFLAMYRQAFAAMVADPGFVADAGTQKLDLEVLKGDEVAKIVKEIVSTPPAVIAKLKAIIRN
jgi:tripartite-type tricarboxylate transporter receptor subunit TctC